MGNATKRHHYLPQFYLKDFVYEKKLCVYDREKNEFRIQTPINTAIEKDYYTFLDKEGEKNKSVEKILADIEGRVIPVINKIRNQEIINDDDKGIMSLFLSLFIYRVPEFEKLSTEIAQKISEFTMKNLISSKEQAANWIEIYKKDTGKSFDVSPEIIFEYAQNAQFEIILDRNTTLKQMLDLSLKNTNWLYNMDWEIFLAPKNSSFITTDNPFVLLPPKGFPIGIRGYGLRTKGVKKIIPLSMGQCILIGSLGNSIKYIMADAKTVRSLNLYIASRCDRFVIGRDEKLLRNIVKSTKIHKWKKSKRINV
ncbi:MAG: DUF4238 domain-containing protein [Candidatus Lokiarchaeota archaeon]|nr:DUF4238 domain-containing protein [Candidatus Lokiarchaeota archaeon]